MQKSHIVTAMLHIHHATKYHHLDLKLLNASTRVQLLLSYFVTMKKPRNRILDTLITKYHTAIVFRWITSNISSSQCISFISCCFRGNCGTMPQFAAAQASSGFNLLSDACIRREDEISRYSISRDVQSSDDDEDSSCLIFNKFYTSGGS